MNPNSFCKNKSGRDAIYAEVNKIFVIVIISHILNDTEMANQSIRKYFFRNLFKFL